MHKRIRTNEQQRATLQQIARLLSEHGMAVHPVSRRSRQHSLDFIAVPQDVYSHFVLVRPMRDGSILVRPYAITVRYEQLKTALKYSQWSVPVVLSDHVLRKPYGKTEWWRLFFPFKVVERNFPTLLAP